MVSADKMMSKATLEGVLERITCFNEDNSYTVARLQVRGQRELVTIVGNMPCPNPGETLRLRGYWTNDPRYGEQFRVDSCLSVLPSTLTGIERYLGSGLVKGIGPIMAKRIVARFSLETLDIIEEDRAVSYDWGELDELLLAYAISIHKSQGSEYPAVVVPLLSQHYVMLQRNLLYTAITRARKLAVIVDSKQAVALAVKNNKVQHRYTDLASRLKGAVLPDSAS